MKKIIRILITDDEQDILDLLKGELTEADESFQIILENSGYNALNHIRANEVDLLITDIGMPDMDGYELYKKTKELYPKMPIIMMTGFGYDPNHTVVNAKKAGLKDVIFKPFDMPKLLTMIYNSIESLNKNEDN
jgi:DNA-binding NtrC family response regulator